MRTRLYMLKFGRLCAANTNIGLYKANADLTSWDKLTISENSETATVSPTNCN